MIVEEEQGGKKRAQYGKAQLQELSQKLTAQLGKGWGAENLRLMRKLYLVFSKEIQNTVLEIPSDSVNPVYPIGEAKTASQSKIVSGVYEIKKTTYPFRLSWSHYLVLMRIDNPDERRFYEIEAAENGWDLDELKRQFNSSLYERLALSRDKKGVLELSKKGQIVKKPEDVVKDPYVLEFLGLEEKARYSETELESRIIEHVEQFMLENGIMVLCKACPSYLNLLKSGVESIGGSKGKGEVNREDNADNREDNADNQTLVMNAIKRNPRLTVRQLATELPISKATIERTLKALQKAGKLRRVGGTRGHWELIGFRQ